MRLRPLLLALSLVCFSAVAQTSPLTPSQQSAEPRSLDLYPGRAPGALGDTAADRPFLDIYLPAANPTHTAVLVIPGGGYNTVVADREGEAPARWLVQRGVAAFVLHYRVAPYRYPVPIDDGRRAMRLLRARAGDFGFAPERLGAWGFSAGGHLASTLATLFDEGNGASPDPVERQGDRPAFVVLAYPVISMLPEVAHTGSLQSLLGAEPDPTLAQLLSTDLQVKPVSPPAFLFVTNDDQVVPSQNSMLYAAACQRAHVPVELHMFEHGRHGVGLAAEDPQLSVWTVLLEHWMRNNGWMGGTPAEAQ